MKKLDDKTLAELANAYTEAYGEELRRELTELEANNVRYATPNMDKRLRREISREKRTRSLRLAAMLAACVALAVILPRVTGLFERGGTISGPPSTIPSAAGSSSPSSGASAPSASEPEIIPLAATLPENFEIGRVEPDNGKTVYYITDALLDHVVLTLERAASIEPESDALRAIRLNGRDAWVSAGADYNLLTFEKEDVVYTLTCKYEISTLIMLGESLI